jgi:ribosomal protein S18 acetylase RimI-like enzyme
VEELSLRPFVEADEVEVASWFTDAGELRFFAGPRLTWPLDAGQWRSLRVDPRVTAWTGVLAERTIPIGHGELVMESADNVRLARLAISPRRRGQGLGRALVMSLIEKSRVDGYKLVTLDVHQDNSTAIRAYRGCGFQPSGTAAVDARVRMELSLN